MNIKHLVKYFIVYFPAGIGYIIGILTYGLFGTIMPFRSMLSFLDPVLYSLNVLLLLLFLIIIAGIIGLILTYIFEEVCNHNDKK